MKWRTISGSAISGSRGGVRRASAGGDVRGRHARIGDPRCPPAGARLLVDQPHAATAPTSASTSASRSMSAARALLGEAHQQHVVHALVVAPERIARVHAELAGGADHLARRPAGADRELLECRSVERRAAAPAAPWRAPPARGMPGRRRAARPGRASSGTRALRPPGSVWLVVMFEVAFSRRMCCSRVCRVSTNPRRPSRSCVSPTIRPGSLRM